MVGHYHLREENMEKMGIPIKNIEENVYDLCCPLLVNDKREVPKELLYLYETLGIPVLTVDEYQKFDEDEYHELEEYIRKFSYYLQLNIVVELSEEEKIGHLLRVGKYARELALTAHLSKKEVDNIYIAALFHDIGKSKIPVEIIGKKNKLSDQEFSIIKTHSDLARTILEDFLEEPILRMIEGHHERMDGSGYAKGIVPDIGVQILGIADSYDAMISSRVYHQGTSRESAFEELLQCTTTKEDGGKGILYNADLVNQFITIQTEGLA